jgi:hypothetical protein
MKTNLCENTYEWINHVRFSHIIISNVYLYHYINLLFRFSVMDTYYVI